MRLSQCIVMFLVLVWGLSLQPTNAEDLKNVSATKYETRAPSKDHSFKRIEALKGYRGVDYPDGLHIVTYTSDNGAGTVHGILDKRGKREKWIVQPHYRYVQVMSGGALVLKRTDGANYCILQFADGECRETDFPYMMNLAYRKWQALPDWVGPRALYIEGAQKHTADVQLFTTDDRPLAIVRGVMRGLMSDAPGPYDYVPKAYKIGDKLSLRTVSEDGEVRDTLVSLDEDGTVSLSHVPAHAIIEYGELKYPPTDGDRTFSQRELERNGLHIMTMTNLDIGLVWPMYDGEDGPSAMPDGVLGLKPLVFDYEGGVIFSRYYGDTEFATHLCCERPLAWAVAWDTPDGALYALLKTANVPDYDAVLASRSAARYTDVEQLWRPAADSSSNMSSARREGSLIGHYAFHSKDGMSEVYGGDRRALPDGVPVTLETSVPSSSFASWYDTQQRKVAAEEEAYLARIKADRERRIAAKRAREQALAEQRLRLQAEADARLAAAQSAAAAEVQAAPQGPFVQKIYGAWAHARIGYCNTNTRQTDLYAEANAKQACRDQRGNPGITYVVQSGYDPYRSNAEQCYQAKAVTECEFD